MLQEIPKSKCAACGKPTSYVLVVEPGKVIPVCKRNMQCMEKIKNG